MEINPYIGITGFKDIKDVITINEQYNKHGMPKGYTAMYGILTSKARIQNPNKTGKRSPSVNKIASIVKAIPKDCLSMLHYHQKEQNGFSEELIDLVKKTGANSVQLNIAWPNPLEVEKLKSENIIVTFQLPKRAIEGLSQEELSLKLREYQTIADYVLLDLSGGTGIEFEVKDSNRLLDIISQSLPNAILGIAGGLTPNNLCSKLQSLKHTQLMFDSESGLMRNNNLDFSLTDKYIRESPKLK